ncbi:MAG TPA: pyridoxal phosphate-dependent aminotransferase family protein [Verrucomicrobiae bacterium]
MTEPEPLQQVDRTYVRWKRRRLSYFGGCDYLRLASHPAVLRALRSGAKEYGLNVAASRLTTGNHTLYAVLERALAGFFGAESALVVPTGYVTNLVVAQALARSFSHALIDERSHLSLLDAAAALECPVLRFKHRDPADARRAVQRCGTGARLILLTDGMFSHDGSVAPLKEYLKCLPRDALLLVDDAHGAGVLGRRGRGTIEHAEVGRERVVQTITLSKAFGVYGGAVLGPVSVRRKMIERSRIFLGGTPLPLPLVSAALQALALVAQAKGKMQQALARNAEIVKNGLRTAGFVVPDYPGPIVAIAPPNARAALQLKRILLAAAIHPPFITYHGGPKNGYFRFVISSEHTPAQLRGLLDALRRWRGIPGPLPQSPRGTVSPRAEPGA